MRIALSPRFLIAAANVQVGMGGAAMAAIARGMGYWLNNGLPETHEGYRAPELDVAVLHHWGYSAHLDVRSGRSSWPLEGVWTPNDIASFGAKYGLIRVTPVEGDILLLFAPQLKAFVRAGVVAHVKMMGRLGPSAEYFDLVSIEADSNDDGARRGGSVRRVERRVCPAVGDRFVRWAEFTGKEPPEESNSGIPQRRLRVRL